MNLKYYASIITGFIETLLFGGLIYGWSGLNYILTREGYFGSSCNASSNSSENVQAGCPDQEYNLELVFTLSVSLSFGLSIANGLILDNFGIWAVRTISSLLLVFSCIVIAFSTPATSYVLYPSMILIGVSGVGLYLTNLETANLLPKWRGVIVSLINGAVVAGIVVFTLAKTAYENEITIKEIFLFLAFLGFFTFIRTFFLMPKILIPHELPEHYYYGIKECCNKKSFDSETELLLVDSANQNEEEVDEKKEEKRLKTYVSTSIYLLGVYSFSIQELRVNFLVESMNAWLTKLLHHNTASVSTFLSAFGYTQISALIFSPIFGVLFDFTQKYYNKKGNLTAKQAALKSLSINCLICSSSTIMYSILTLIPLGNLQYISFILAVISNALVSANISLLVIQCFPMEYIGTLLGISVLLCAVVASFQYPFYYVAVHYFDGSFFAVDIFMLFLAVTTLAHPYNLYRCSKSAE